MLTKVERFEQWLGKNKELDTLKTISLIGDYLEYTDSLDCIQTDLIQSDSELYTRWNQYNKRSIGILVYCKLVIEETLDLLPPAAEERKLLTDLRTLLSAEYEHPTKDVTKNINDTIETIQGLLGRDIKNSSFKNQDKMLCLTLYAALQVLHLSIQSFTGWKKVVISSIVDIDHINVQTEALLKKTEQRIIQLDKVLQPTNTTDTIKVHSPLHKYFNNRFLMLLNVSQQDDKCLHSVELGLDEVIASLDALIKAKSKNNDIRSSIHKLRRLLEAADQNDKQPAGKKYFLDFIQDHREAFHFLMNHSNSGLKEQLEAKMIVLSKPTFFQNSLNKLVYAFNGLRSLVNVMYGYVVRQPEQIKAVSKWPTALDSESQATLRMLAKECFIDLELQLKQSTEEVEYLIQLLIDSDEAVKSQLEQETPESLYEILEMNRSAKHAIRDYQRLFNYFKEKRTILMSFKNTCCILDDFIQKNDNWLVKLSNFFAKISTIFKTETASMIDSARELQTNLMDFEIKYKKELRSSLVAIEQNPDLPIGLKTKFKTEFEGRGGNLIGEKVSYSANKQKVREILYNTPLFFKAKVADKLPISEYCLSAVGEGTNALR
jgi:hypothetical protein